MRSVSWQTWTDVQRLCCVTNEWPFQDHLSSTTLPIQWALSPTRPQQMCWGFPGWPFQDHLHQHYHTDLMSSVSRDPWTNMQRFPSVTDEQPLQDHHLSKYIISTGGAQSPSRPEHIYRGFGVSVMNALYKTICQVPLLYQLNGLGLLGDLNEKFKGFLVSVIMFFTRPSSEKAYSIKSFLSVIHLKLSPGRHERMCKGFPASVMNTLYKTIFQVSLCLLYSCIPQCHQLEALSSSRLERKCGDFPVSVMNGLLKTIFWVSLQ